LAGFCSDCGHFEATTPRTRAGEPVGRTLVNGEGKNEEKRGGKKGAQIRTKNHFILSFSKKKEHFINFPTSKLCPFQRGGRRGKNFVLAKSRPKICCKLKKKIFFCLLNFDGLLTAACWHLQN
jgi:hypothetical protein